MAKIELGKQYRTRDGREARVYAVDARGWFPVHAAYCVPGDIGWSVGEWRENGKHRECADLDLIEVKPTITRTYWLVHLTDRSAGAYTDNEFALRRARELDAQAVTGPHEVTFIEGEGL
jgi:hypothetical protein